MNSNERLLEMVWQEDRPFVHTPGRTLSTGDVAQRAAFVSKWLLRASVTPGDRVLALLDSSPDVISVMLGSYLARAIHVPVNTRYRNAELEHIFADARPAALVTSRRFQPLLSPFEASIPTLYEDDITAHPDAIPIPTDFADNRDTAHLIYTSGTTGRSKGVELTFGNIIAGIGALTDLWKWTPEDRLVLALPLYHVHGLCIGIHGSLLQRNTIEILPGFDPVSVGTALEAGGTIFMGVPTMYHRIVTAFEDGQLDPAPFQRARLFTSGSAALSPHVFDAFARWTGHRILERYGMSETLLTLSNPWEPERRKPGTVGFPVGDTRIRIVDEEGHEMERGPGTLHVKGSSVMKGYWRQPAATDAAFSNGWFVTGDVVTRDDDLYIRIVGRQSVDIIKTGGFKVSAREIEDVIQSVEGVREVAVIGLPDAEWGESIHAVLVADLDRWPDTRSRVESVLSQTLAAFKRPRTLHRWDELPRNAMGKVQKHRIKQELE